MINNKICQALRSRPVGCEVKSDPQAAPLRREDAQLIRADRSLFQRECATCYTTEGENAKQKPKAGVCDATPDLPGLSAGSMADSLSCISRLFS
jgi:hypothetical protein